MRAMKQAAAVQQREAGLMQQRKAWRQPLASRDDIRAAALAVANGWALPPVTGKSPSRAFYVSIDISHGTSTPLLQQAKKTSVLLLLL